jgi:hypothetical protein
MKWVKTLIIAENESLERRLAAILNYIVNTYGQVEWQLSDIDATGKLGNQLTDKMNNESVVQLNNSELLSLLTEDGQIFELDLRADSPNFQIIVRYGDIVDILGDRDVPPVVIGQYTDRDLSNYYF